MNWIRRIGMRAPLRVKLVAALLLLVIAALVGSGVAATATMRNYLLGRVDSQLDQTQRPFLEHGLSGVFDGTEGPGHGGPEAERDGGPDENPTHLPSAYVVAVTDADGVIVYGPTSALLDSAEPLPALPHMSAADSEAHGRSTFTVPAVSGDREWRVLAQPVTLTDGSTGTLLIAQSLNDVQNTVHRLVLLLLLIGAAAVVLLAGVGYVVVRTSLRPLREVERTAAHIAAGDLSRRVPDADPRTEVGQLAGALNRMLHEIEGAFADRAASEQAARNSEDRMRRFVADASHELRTPLTTIRGFAELYRQGAVGDPAETAGLMHRIEDEAKRMGLLVEDLLLLARLDQQRPFAQLPVDLLALANDAVQAARATDPERPIRLQIGATDPPPIVMGDEARLRQVLANLVGNALRHTPSGTPVTVTVSTEPSPRTGAPAAILAVSDQGPGIARQDAARIFERFYRTDQSRNRDEGGTGLGLAIVSAIVAGHGGTIEVETAPGAGARFRVELPVDSERPASGKERPSPAGDK
jgi:two-component system OmpR family sensor kinase